MEPLYRRAWDAAELKHRHPPRFRHPHKRAVHERTDAPWSGRVEVARYPAAPLPERFPETAPEVGIVPGPMGYADARPGTWHVNFADPHLFGYYAGPLLAQDELQCLEHPALGSVREALLAEGLPAMTRDGGRPTPVLVRGVPRTCHFDTGPSARAPSGLYGNRFAAAPLDAVLLAARPVRPPTTTHLVAMAALAGGAGPYTRLEVEDALQNAYTAFRAAAVETAGPTEVRTGFWGGGAFGGDRELMVTAQLLAARLAGVDAVVVYTFDAASAPVAEAARERAEALAAPGDRVGTVVDRLLARGYRWGAANGT